MKETIKNLGKLLVAVVLLMVAGCQDDDNSFGSITAPSNLELGYTIEGVTADTPNGDGSGNVLLTAHADNAITYKFIYPDGTSTTTPTGQVTKRFTTTGVNSYDVTVIAYGTGGVSTTGMITVVDLLSSFDDPVTVQKLTGGSSKVWYWAASENGHLGVGPNTADGNNYWAEWYMAAPFEKAGSETSSCLYNNKLTFTKDGNFLKFTLDNGGATFFNAGYTSVGGGTQTDDTCLPYDTSGQKTVMLEPALSYVAPEFTTGTQLNITGGGFMGYYIGTSTYEILELTDNRMVVRAVQGNNPGLAWYHIFTTQDPYGTPDPVFNNLAWADEFDIDGAPDSSKWNMETGNNNGWGNNELENYKAQNATISGGTLKITAKKETTTIGANTYNYTSARMNTHNHFDFKYGRVDIKAKLPTGQGIWPALWMLGSNYQTNAWPACGEIDIMENKNGENVVQSTLHYPGHSGGNADGTAKTVTGLSTDFKIYTVLWTDTLIKFYVKTSETDPNPILIKQFTNSPSLHPYFNLNFFLILNVATGGDFAGMSPAADFTQSTMEVDYVRVYQ